MEVAITSVSARRTLQHACNRIEGSQVGLTAQSMGAADGGIIDRRRVAKMTHAGLLLRAGVGDAVAQPLTIVCASAQSATLHTPTTWRRALFHGSTVYGRPADIPLPGWEVECVK